MTDTPTLAELLRKLAEGTISLEQALEVLPELNDRMEAIDGATVDLGRRARCGFAEVIYGQGKPAELVCEIASVQLEANQSALVTRVTPEVAQTVQCRFPWTRYNPDGRTLTIGREQSPTSSQMNDQADAEEIHVAVVTAGSTDQPVAEEAMETLSWMKIPFQHFQDIGVAGPQRLLAAVPQLRRASAVIVIAGMEGALPAAVAGHLSVPIFAVPTSVGYGATLGGLTPLMGMLSSCSANVAVVNIDAGFKGAYLAGLVAHQLRLATKSSVL